MSIQLQVKLGDRVKIVIPPENVAYGNDKVYPQGGTGTVSDFVDKAKRNHGCYSDHNTLAYVKLDIPFRRTGLLSEELGEKIARRGTKSKIMEEMYVPTWLLAREGEK